MKLLVANNFANKDHFTERLRLFKYRGDVKLLGRLSRIELSKVTAAAYAVICLFMAPASYMPVVEAMRSNVPVVTSDSDAIQEICGDAALYANYDDYKDIADKIILIFKDERFRTELILKGKIQVDKYSWEKVSGLLWQSILKATS